MQTDDIIQRLNQYHPNYIDLSLKRINRLLDSLGNPQDVPTPVIHIAGTNGKGSTLAFIQSIAEAADLKVNIYTSPHLVHFNERIRINGKPIANQELCDLIFEVENKNKEEPITFFEITTAIAFLAFSRTPADLILLETGLGGRLDATNVIKRPTVTVLSPISHDHEHFLGNNLGSIAKEKAGIMKPGVPCVSAKQDPPVLDVIRQSASDKGVPLYIENTDWWVAVKGERISVITQNGEVNAPLPNLIGPHQVQNSGLAIVALAELGEDRITSNAVNLGMKRVDWPARMQILTRGPLCKLIPPGWELWLDGGHNPAAGLALASTIRTFNQQPIHLIVGLIKTKSPSQFLAPLKKYIKSLSTVEIPNTESSYSASEIFSVAREIGLKTEVARSVEHAISKIVRKEKSACKIIICGSLYLAGSVLRDNQ